MKIFSCWFFLYMKPKFACISSTVLSFFSPLDYFHSTTISLCDYSACVTSSNLPLLFPNWEAGRHMSWRRVAGSGFASQLVSASSHVRWCQLRDFCFVSEKFLCREASQLHCCAFGGHILGHPAVRLWEGFSMSASNFKLICLISG